MATDGQVENILENDRKVLELIGIVNAEHSRSSQSRQLSIANEVDDMKHRLALLHNDYTNSGSRVESLLKSFQDPLIRTFNEISALSQAFETKLDKNEMDRERKEILKWLSDVPYKKHHRSVSRALLPRNRVMVTSET
jgi:hypothetical protein